MELCYCTGQVSPQVSAATGHPLLFWEGFVCAKNGLKVVAINKSSVYFNTEVQSMLYVQKKKCRVHSLTGRITNPVMLKAFKAVKRNRGTAGIDKESIKMFESNLDENLNALMRELKTGTYKPIPLKRVYVPKGKGKLRPLGIPAVRCRVAQEVVRSFALSLHRLPRHSL